MKQLSFFLLPAVIFLQGCGLAIPVATTMAEKGYDYGREGTVIDAMICPLELCMEYGRLALREMNITYREEKEEFFWRLQGTLPEREATIQFYPISDKLTKVKAKVYLASNPLNYLVI